MNTSLIQKSLAAVALVGLTVTAAVAGPPHNINRREAEQAARLRAGSRNGSLTYAERARLQRREASIPHQEAHYRATGGHLSVAERARLEHRLNSTSRVIYHNKHDYQRYHH